MSIVRIAPVVATVTVAVPPESAWATFTERIGDWWPTATHSIGEDAVVSVGFEEHIGGRIFERWRDGTELPWGRVTIWNPPHRLGFSWRPSVDSTHEPTQVEVTFTPVDAGTQVRLTHSGWELLGARAEPVRNGYLTGWPIVLQGYVERAAT